LWRSGWIVRKQEVIRFLPVCPKLGSDPSRFPKSQRGSDLGSPIDKLSPTRRAKLRLTQVQITRQVKEEDVNQAALIELIRQAASLLWLVLAIVWIVSALRTKRTVKSQSSAAQLLYTVLLIVGAYMIFAPQIGTQWLDRQLFPVTVPIAVAGLLVVLIGVAFTIWARFMLGTNWSNNVTVKEDHTLVRTGPYRIARHPIYSGILLGMLGSALQRGGIRCFIGVLFFALSYWLKSRAEERFMVQNFGEEYLQYRHKVKALVPFIF
jgi:protein-S-isoprenylcysteine O-methyltransferase Ste14